MANWSNKFKNSYKLFEFFYPLLVGIIILQLLFFPEIRLGVATSLLILILLYKNLSKRILLHNSTINKLVLLYISYNTVSIVWFLFTGFPVSVFIAEWSNSILPIFFFYFAYVDVNRKNSFYNITLGALFVSFLIGFSLWILEPPFYRVFMDTTEGPGTDMLFFQSLFGLTATGVFGFVGFLISSHIVFTSNARKGKISLIVCMLATILTFRRSSLFVLAFSILIMHFIGYFRYGFVKKRYFLIEALFLYGIYIYVAGNYGDFFTSLIERGSMISEAFNERSGTWNFAFDNGNLIMGDGLGAFGHKAIGYNKVLIPDGNYFKIFAEIGAIGTLLFFFIIVSSIVFGFMNFRNKYLELGIVFGLSLIAVGSNVFSYQSLMPIFWYSIGRLSLKYKENEKLCVKENNLNSMTNSILGKLNNRTSE